MSAVTQVKNTRTHLSATDEPKHTRHIHDMPCTPVQQGREESLEYPEMSERVGAKCPTRLSIRSVSKRSVLTR
jgi:hypothetical protein